MKTNNVSLWIAFGLLAGPALQLLSTGNLVTHPGSRQESKKATLKFVGQLAPDAALALRAQPVAANLVQTMTAPQVIDIHTAKDPVASRNVEK